MGYDVDAYNNLAESRLNPQNFIFYFLSAIVIVISFPDSCKVE